MGLDFKIKDFAYPIAILKLRSEFERNQWRDEEYLLSYRLKRLKLILEHAGNNIPYYKGLFQKNGIIPSDIIKLSDLKTIPVLTKDILRTNFSSLSAKDVRKYNPTIQHTSGTTGKQILFYTDKSSNILEFVYYWRFWGWAGYRVGGLFAELSAQFFTPYEEKKDLFYHYEPITRRLLVNSLSISHDNIENYANIFKKYRPSFLKGLPSNLYMLATIFRDREDLTISFKAIFSQGENLLKYQRELIEKVFSCKVYDSYGHMERTVAISQCPFGTYHVHSDYGIAEFEKLDGLHIHKDDGSSFLAEIIGTSLHNYAMPLVRYRTGDYARIPIKPERCKCGRGFPTIISIEGRSVDVIVTPDGRAITALYVALDRTPGIDLAQIVQQSVTKIIVRVALNPTCRRSEVEGALIRNLRDFVGDDMEIEIIYESVERLKGSSPGKFKVIVSDIKRP